MIKEMSTGIVTENFESIRNENFESSRTKKGIRKKWADLSAASRTHIVQTHWDRFPDALRSRWNKIMMSKKKKDEKGTENKVKKKFSVDEDFLGISLSVIAEDAVSEFLYESDVDNQRQALFSVALQKQKEFAEQKTKLFAKSKLNNYRDTYLNKIFEEIYFEKIMTTTEKNKNTQDEKENSSIKTYHTFIKHSDVVKDEVFY